MRTLTLIILAFLCALPASVALMDETAGKGQAAPAPEAVSMEIKDLPVSIAISRLFVDYGLSSQLDTESLKSLDRKISLNLSNVPWTDALSAMTRAAGVTYSVQKGKYSFENAPQQYTQQVLQAPINFNSQQAMRNSPPNAISNRVIRGTTDVTPRKRGATQVFDLTLDQANVFDVIRQLMDLSKREYVLDLGPAADYGVAPPRVTARLSNVSVDEFLSMLKNNSDIQTQRMGKQTVIRWRPKDIAASRTAAYRGSYILTYAVLAIARTPLSTAPGTPASNRVGDIEALPANDPSRGIQLLERGSVLCWAGVRWVESTDRPAGGKSSAGAALPANGGTKKQSWGIVTPAPDGLVNLEMDYTTSDSRTTITRRAMVRSKLRLGQAIMIPMELVSGGTPLDAKAPRLMLAVSVKIDNQSTLIPPRPVLMRPIN